MLYNRSFLFDITMENYLLVCLLLMTDDSRLVLSFSSEKCNHDQLGFHLEDSMNCVAKLMFNKKNTSQVNLTSQAMKSFDIMVNVGHQCMFINDITYCFINHFGQCFNEQNNEGIAYIINVNLAKILNATCDQKQDSQNKEEDSTYFWTLFYSYQSNSKFPLSFDRPCSNHELVSAFFPGVYPCIERYVISIFSSLTQFVINLLVSIPSLLGRIGAPSSSSSRKLGSCLILGGSSNEQSIILYNFHAHSTNYLNDAFSL